MGPGEIFFIIALLLPLIPMAIAKQWWLFKVFGLFYLSFGLTEWWAVSTTGNSVSQHFWLYSETNPKGAFIILGCMGIMWVALLLHLGTKLTKKEK